MDLVWRYLTGFLDVCASVGDLFDEGSQGVDLEVHPAVLADVGGARVVEIDTQVGVVSLHRGRDVLDHGDVEGDRDPKHREDDRLVFGVHENLEWGCFTKVRSLLHLYFFYVH